MDLLYGILETSCLLPCLRTSATVERKMTTAEDSTTLLSLNFDPDVRVKKTSVDEFSFMDCLNFFGSNLGLWPGLGLYQILERLLAFIIMSQVVRRCSKLSRTF